jgi:PAS domain S-box-containing protein
MTLEVAEIMERAAHRPTPQDLGFGVLFGSIRDAVIVGDAESGRIVLWNPAAEALFGYPAAEAVGMPLEVLVPERLREAHRNGLARYTAGEPGPLLGAAHPTEIPALRRDGEEITVELTLNPLEETRTPGRYILALVRDATARQGLERERTGLLAAAQESGEQFRTAFDFAAIGMALVGLDGRFLRVNAALCELTGYPEPELLTRTFQDITHPDDLEADLAHLGHLLAGDIRAYEMEKRYIHKTGDVVWGHLSVALVRDQHGSPLHFVSQIEDISARKAAELALEGERYLLHALMTNLPDAVYFKDAQHCFVRVNPAAAALYGLDDPDEAVGLTDFDVFPEEQARQFREDERPVLEVGTPLVNRLEQHADAGNARRWTLATKVPIVDPGGRVSGLVGISRDISDLVRAEEALRQSEERFRSAFDHASIGMDMVDLDGRFLQVNSALCELTGYPEEEMLARTFEDITLPEDQEEDLALVNQLLAGEIPSFQLEKRYVRKDGQIIWGRVNSTLVRDQNGLPLHFISMIEDITDRKAVEAERSLLQAELEAELQRAATIQRPLLTQSAPAVPGYEFAGVCLPARQAGGDFFDWQCDHETVHLSLGDVMGKGMPAALLMATGRAALRAVAHLPAAQAVKAVNHTLFPDLGASDSFITLFHAHLDLATGNLSYVDAGHGLGLIQRRDGVVESLGQPGLPLGILADTVYEARSVTLGRGDTLLLYSDGLPDARPELHLDRAGIAAQLDGVIGAREKLERLRVLATAGTALPDDLTLVLVRRLT